jgi:hypothetical protein
VKLTIDYISNGHGGMTLLDSAGDRVGTLYYDVISTKWEWEKTQLENQPSVKRAQEIVQAVNAHAALVEAARAAHAHLRYLAGEQLGDARCATVTVMTQLEAALAAEEES